ncbi:hypothetical protein GOP47_0027766 [Adiantum capillus-veneris]|nr:hypothetical protein GOP47_0027766 [Adiantum capillus-veneris]
MGGVSVQSVVEGVGWWWLLGVGIPFAAYSLPFLLGDFNLYKHLTIAALAGRFDIAGLHIVDHVALWQLHSLAGLVFLFVAPYQFSGSFRGRHLKLHRRMGYAFVGVSLFLAVTGSTTMLMHSEFGLLGRTFMGIAAMALLICLVRAVGSARNKQFEAHRRWMIRTTIMGYGVLNSRIVLLVLQKGLGFPVLSVADLSILISWLAGEKRRAEGREDQHGALGIICPRAKSLPLKLGVV